VRKTRRGPWLSGLIIAVIGSVWLAGQVIGGAIGLLGDLMFPPDPWAAPPGSAAPAGVVHAPW